MGHPLLCWNGLLCPYTGGPVDLGDVLHVAEAFFSGGLRFLIVLDAVGEVLGFGLKVRRIARGVGLVQFFTGGICAQVQAFVDEGVVHVDETL